MFYPTALMDFLSCVDLSLTIHLNNVKEKSDCKFWRRVLTTSRTKDEPQLVIIIAHFLSMTNDVNETKQVFKYSGLNNTDYKTAFQ